MYVDLDAKEMGMVVRAKDAKDEAGKDLGVIIRGFDAGEGLHPCISTYMGNTIKLNFGREPFQLTPPEGFLPIECVFLLPPLLVVSVPHLIWPPCQLTRLPPPSTSIPRIQEPGDQLCFVAGALRARR